MIEVSSNTPIYVRVGDSGSLVAFSIKAPSGAARDLTGYFGGVSFWYPGAAAPHVVRPAEIDLINDSVVYRLQGDEFTTVGTCVAQPTIASTATAFKPQSSDMVRFKVLGATP